jgi:hypothetical protein
LTPGRLAHIIAGGEAARGGVVRSSGVRPFWAGGWRMAVVGSPPRRAPRLISVRGAFCLGSGDMMRDRVPRLGVRPLILQRLSWAASSSELAGAGRRIIGVRARRRVVVALGNTQLKVYHKLLSSPGMRYQDLGPDYYERQASTRRQIAHHVGKLGVVGFEVTLCRLPEPDPGHPA